MNLAAQLEQFCFDCEYCEECGGFDYAYGAPLFVSETTCPGLGDPGDMGCPRHDEYEELRAEYDVIEEREVSNNGKNDR